jgi:PIN domain nuclease of toxin-antitoxin system
MLRGVADTHTAVWYIYNDQRLSTPARVFIEAAATDGDEIGVSAITFVELTYLIEKGRIEQDVYARLTTELEQPGAVLRDLAFTRPVADTLSRIDRNAVPDMPDRIIAATASQAGVPLISRDRKIRLSNVSTIW